MSNKATNPSSETEPVHDGRVRGKLHSRLHSNPALSLTSKIVVTTVGVLVICAGLVMMVTPGPGIVALVLGLAVLSSEWDWADRLLQVAKKKASDVKARAEAMDPKVRRRRALLSGLSFIVVVGGSVTYLVLNGWPSIAVDAWDWIQGVAGWLPELPGM